MKYTTLFTLVFLSCFPLWAQQDSTAVRGDSSRVASWALYYDVSEMLNSGLRFGFENTLSPKNLGLRYFISPTYYAGPLSAAFTSASGLPGPANLSPNLGGQLRGGGLALGLRFRPGDKPFYPESGITQGYLQFSLHSSLLSRKFEDVGWVIEDGVYRQGLVKLQERLYRAGFIVGGGLRTRAFSGAYLDFFVGIAYRQAWQRKSKNHGWPQEDNSFMAWNYRGIAPQLRARLGWAKQTGKKRFVPTPQRKIRFEEKQKSRYEAYLKQREGYKKNTPKPKETEEEKKRRWVMTEEERLRQDSIALAHRIRTPQKKWVEIQDSAFYGKWAVGLNLHPFAMNALQPEFCLAVFTDSARAHMTHFYASPAVYLPLGSTLERPRQGWGLQVGVRQRFGGLPFHFHRKKLQGYVDYFVGYHRTAGEMLVEVDAQPFPFEEVQALHMQRADFGLGFGARLCGKKAFYLDFFGAFVYRLAWSPELKEREGKHSVDDDFMNPLFQGVAPQLGLRVGFMKMSQRRQHFTRKVEEK